MKKLSLLALPLILAACGNTNLPGTGTVGMSANITGAKIVVDLAVTRDTDGTVTSLSSLTTTTQPNVSLNVAAGSLGSTLTGFKVTVLDSAGVQFAGTEGSYQRSFSQRVAGGFGCKNGTATDFSTDQCDYANKVPYNRVVTLPAQLPMINDAVSRMAATMYVENYPEQNCPTLKMKVVLTGYDDNNRDITPIVVDNVPVDVTCNTK